MKLELEASALLIGEADEIYDNREVVAIECLLMEGAVNGIINIKLQLLTCLEENGWCLNGNNFIINITLCVS